MYSLEKSAAMSFSFTPKLRLSHISAFFVDFVKSNQRILVRFAAHFSCPLSKLRIVEELAQTDLLMTRQTNGTQAFDLEYLLFVPLE
jgi:hypothetical protein